MPLYAVVRIRGLSGARPDVEKTLYLLRLRRRFAASIYHDSLPGIYGMLKKVENWATWGEIDRETLLLLLRRRGRILGDKPLTDEWVREKLGLSGLEELADKLLKGELHYHRLEEYGVKPFFRLHPPRGAFKNSIKRHYGDKGELGYRGSAINELLKRMI